MFWFSRSITPEDSKEDIVDNTKCSQAAFSPQYSPPTPPDTPGPDRPGIRGLLTQVQEKEFNKFKTICAEQDLLKKPEDVRDEQLLDGINDESSLL